MEVPSFSTLKLQFGHDCRNLGCNMQGCELCRNNLNRRCQSHFREKYVDNANRVLTAGCGAPILARVVDAVTGDEYEENHNEPRRLDGVLVQLFLLEGNSYDQREQEVGSDNITEQDYELIMLLDNTSSSKAEPLLVPGKGCAGEHTADNKLVIPFQAEGTPILVRTSRSSQSAQGGRTRPFRLMARAIYEDGTLVPFILPDVSEPFVVTTRRTQAAEKALVPRWDDSVSRLPGVGKETFAKLKDLRAAGLCIELENYRIQTVGQLFELIDQADAGLLSDLGRALGLKQDKVTELQQNARTVAREDSRKRVWGSPDFPSDRLVYPCEGGAVDLLREHIEVMRDTDDGAEIIMTEDLPAEDLLRVVQMRQLAFASWWAPGHPGWGIIDALGPPESQPGVTQCVLYSLSFSPKWQACDQNLVRRHPRNSAASRPLSEQPCSQQLADDESALLAAGVPALPQLLPTLSLRQQMDRQCKQRHFCDPLDDAFPDPVEDERPPPLLPANHYLGITVKTEQTPREHPSFEFDQRGSQEHDSGSTTLLEHCMPARSVFDMDAYPEHGGPPEQRCDACAKMWSLRQSGSGSGCATKGDPLYMPGAPREVHPNAQDISNAVSAGALLEQPIGLAYITAAPTFERSGPIRFKRSVSGNRYKPMAGEQSCLAPPGSKGGDYGGSGFDARLASPQQPPQQQQQAVGIFHAHGLLPKPSRELRSQTSLDKVAFWQQTRPLSSSILGERYSQNQLLFGLVDEDPNIDYEAAQEFEF